MEICDGLFAFNWKLNKFIWTCSSMCFDERTRERDRERASEWVSETGKRVRSGAFMHYAYWCCIYCIFSISIFNFIEGTESSYRFCRPKSCLQSLAISIQYPAGIHNQLAVILCPFHGKCITWIESLFSLHYEITFASYKIHHFYWILLHSGHIYT